jgi:glycosyltransferase involved in cell wall biosynthesis
MASETAARERPHVSACIITLNEEDRIADCIRSVDWCDEVVVVDSHSADRTREIAAGMGARVIERDWPGHVAQKEFAIRAAHNDWVFCIDADDTVGWTMPRMSSYLGRWIRHGTWYPDLSLRLFDRRHGHWGGNDPHDRVELDGRPGRLTNRLLHHPYRNFAEHLQTIDRYTTIMAQGSWERGRRAHVSDVVLRPAVRFVRFYFLKAGFLEGWRGLLLAYLAAHYVRLKYAKLLVLQRRSELQGSPEDDGRS